MFRFLANVNSRSLSLYVVVLPSVVCLSVTFVHSTQKIEILAMFLCHLVPWPSVDIQEKFYEDRLRGTPPLGKLNTTWVTEYSDFWTYRTLYLGNGAR